MWCKIFAQGDTCGLSREARDGNHQVHDDGNGKVVVLRSSAHHACAASDCLHAEPINCGIASGAKSREFAKCEVLADESLCSYNIADSSRRDVQANILKLDN
jgi:hypothetical protein